MINMSALFDFQHSMAAEWLQTFTFPWEALSGISQLIRSLGAGLDPEEYSQVQPEVWIHRTARVAPTALLNGPCIICGDAEIRHCAFIRGSALVGKGCVVGNSVELKNCILFDGVQVPHFNYVGDSILGWKSHMGAGAVTSNVKSDKTSVAVRDGEKRVETGLKKFGAILGDRVEVGCNSVLNPGTIIGAGSRVYPLSCVRGTVPPNSIWKTGGVISPIE